MNGEGQQQPGPSNALPWAQPALADILAALQMQFARTAAESSRGLFGGQQPSPVLPSTSSLVSPLQPTPAAPPALPQLNAVAAAAAAAVALTNPAPLPLTPPANPLLQTYQQLLNPAFLGQLVAQQTAQFRLPLLENQMTSSMSLPSLRQVAPQLPHVASLPNTAAAAAAAALPARPVPRKPSTVAAAAAAAAVTTTTATSPPVTAAPSVASAAAAAAALRTNGIFAVPQHPPIRKRSYAQSRPSTSSEKPKPPSAPKSPQFEMGKLPTKNYVPSHFMKGTMIQMANGKLKKVEEMSSDDFLLSAPLSKLFNVDASVVLEIARASTLARVKFAVGHAQYKATLEPQLEHPFFVLGKGWSSCDPRRTAETFGLECQELKAGDVCISLSRRTDDTDTKQLDQTITLAEASELKDKEAAQAAIREQLSKEMPEGDGRSSEPPNCFHPYAKKVRKVSES
ncbi:hypothetical protein Q1695_010156 [Nippostrongylus brasiliensis]|nr:hypothetical protein Q1695_010156 [Nippostrongylus brasiliensis]